MIEWLMSPKSKLNQPLPVPIHTRIVDIYLRRLAQEPRPITRDPAMISRWARA